MTSIDENVKLMIDAWKLMVGRMPNAIIDHSGGIATMFANIPLPFLNVSILDSSLTREENLRATLAVVRERAAACAHPSMLVLADDWTPENRERIAHEEGFEPVMVLTGMDANQLLTPRRPAPDLEIRRVAGEAGACDLAMINAHAYGMPTEMFEGICNMNLWHDDSYGFVGYAGGRPVSASAAFPVDGTVYIALVATMPDSHGKGYAEAVMRHAIEQGCQGLGLSRCTLHASDMGHPLYKSMGFRTGGRLTIYSLAGAN